ncbi:uncharacterized protein LOC126657398 [Mercurialis annua]|uniref:uncharacterized protein LOC126657398 n=1 Tax=Mercurialis annua TaxID=3986 RepID=UPI00215F12E7|nr:uncharacterized protein LOC126657398 [Mercurialis annua]
MGFKISSYSRTHIFTTLPFFLLTLILLKQNPVFESKKQVVIEIDKIKKALWDSDFKIMSLMLENNLRSVIPNGEFKNGKITLPDHDTVTIFIPNDNATHFSRRRDPRDFELQVVTSRVDEKAFDSGFLSEGSQLSYVSLNPNIDTESFFFKSDRKLIVQKYGKINRARITHWDIYDDSRVLVHGVDRFFYYKSAITASNEKDASLRSSDFRMIKPLFCDLKKGTATLCN